MCFFVGCFVCRDSMNMNIMMETIGHRWSLFVDHDIEVCFSNFKCLWLKNNYEVKVVVLKMEKNGGANSKLILSCTCGCNSCCLHYPMHCPRQCVACKFHLQFRVPKHTYVLLKAFARLLMYAVKQLCVLEYQ